MIVAVTTVGKELRPLGVAIDSNSGRTCACRARWACLPGLVWRQASSVLLQVEGLLHMAQLLWEKQSAPPYRCHAVVCAARKLHRCRAVFFRLVRLEAAPALLVEL
eukprot:TRINITY_DN114612_c0_g1_i1.p1 TRINITY_DN114612_c0_g1~~TRINITY_DN114612_c0_g1_i1.p1  ORF type:complete len:106 (+),score=4.62 TRINITY_DN114612_c0_g1_i1:1-318(+)